MGKLRLTDNSMIKNNELKFFEYTRKSSEDSQRQVASIGDQIDIMQKIVEGENLCVVDIFKEEMSAKQPGRPLFNEMLERIEKGDANAILCWDIDRMYRNPLDEGRLRWMLQKGIIKVIKTPYRQFYPDDAGLLMGVEGGRATDYVIRLSKNVRRGLSSRIAKGWRPNLAPIGYKNEGVKGEKIIVPDGTNFELVRKMWDLLLTGSYSVSKILDTANNEWGLRTTVRRRLGGKPLSQAQIYKMFNDPFYYGYFWWTNPSTEQKELIKGSHQAMITDKEYWRAQTLLGRKGKQQPKTREFYVTGLMKCGECGGNVTAEEKHQIICTQCKYKFGYENKTACPKCSIEISEMKDATIMDYTYIHCTKKINKNCTQRSIRLDELEKQFDAKLADLKIDEDYLQIALDYLQEKQQSSGNAEQKTRESLQTAYDNCQTRIKNLHREYTSPQNLNHVLYTPEEFAEEKKTLVIERSSIEKHLKEIKENFDHSLEATERTYNFCAFARRNFDTKDIQKKREIFSTIGSNLILKDKILNIEKLHPYLLIENELKAQKALFASLERKKITNPEALKTEKDALLQASLLMLRRR
ncbi:MAG: hypothetical protein FGM57_02290 [Candidatus Taylorbacteria bacterium]|nr:hypothetical protein [Candidatus Taylorbacteria bacterium]